ncbi:hypothetical protein niasHT_022095 [Heterodera trifolii]|uniref:Uncharacterized protein n=1 Tax=Heterodera trifolii TaxID=157864 RepID=A0ABD2KA48_9BILA
MFKFFILSTLFCLVCVANAVPAENEERFCHSMADNSRYKCVHCNDPKEEEICVKLRALFETVSVSAKLETRLTFTTESAKPETLPPCIEFVQTETNAHLDSHRATFPAKSVAVVNKVDNNSAAADDDKQLPVAVVVVLSVLGVLFVQGIIALLVFVCKSVKWQK